MTLKANDSGKATSDDVLEAILDASDDPTDFPIQPPSNAEEAHRVIVGDLNAAVERGDVDAFNQIRGSIVIALTTDEQ